MFLLHFPRFPFTFPHQPSFQITPRPPFPDVTHQSPILRWEIQKQCCLFQTWESDAWYIWTVLWSAGWTFIFTFMKCKCCSKYLSQEKRSCIKTEYKWYECNFRAQTWCLSSTAWVIAWEEIVDRLWTLQCAKIHQQELQFSTTESFHVLEKIPFCEEI